MNQKSNLTLRKVFERFSYGCGDFGCNIIYTAMSAFLLFYYTDYAACALIPSPSPVNPRCSSVVALTLT